MWVDPEVLIYGAVFVGMLLLIEGAYYLFRDWRQGPSKAINRRLRMLAATERRTVLRRLRREEQDALSRLLAKVFPFADRLMVQAGATSGVTSLVSAMAGAFIVALLVLRVLLLLPLLPSVLAALAAGTLAPLALLMLKRRNRLKRFGEQFPDTLDLLVRSLRAGHPVSSAMGLVAEESADPVGTEFGIAVDEMTYGLALDEALVNMATRVPHPDLQFANVAIQIQHATGGDLAEVLGNLAAVIRDRFRMHAKIRAISAEGRASVFVIGALPFVVLAALLALRPNYYGDVSADPLFPQLLAGAGVLWLLGIVTVLKMVNIRV
jgi:tight adherence protein B